MVTVKEIKRLHLKTLNGLEDELRQANLNYAASRNYEMLLKLVRLLSTQQISFTGRYIIKDELPQDRDIMGGNHAIQNMRKFVDGANGTFFNKAILSHLTTYQRRKG